MSCTAASSSSVEAAHARKLLTVQVGSNLTSNIVMRSDWAPTLIEDSSATGVFVNSTIDFLIIYAYSHCQSVTRKNGCAFKFDGSNYLNLSPYNSFPTGAASVMFWRRKKPGDTKSSTTMSYASSNSVWDWSFVSDSNLTFRRGGGTLATSTSLQGMCLSPRPSVCVVSALSPFLQCESSC